MNPVIVYFADGKSKAGKALFFNVNKQTFPLQVETAGGELEVLTIRLDEVKKILFLKKDADALPESPVHRETIDQSTFASSVALKLAVELQDGELLTGSTVKYNPNDKGFFMMPLNPADPSERIYINSRLVRNVEQRKLLGRILVDERKISNGQLEKAGQVQAENRAKRIGTILVEKAMISQVQLDESLKKQRERTVKLGELLIEAGYISQEQLDSALRIQKEFRNKRLGQILVDLKYVTPNDICLALASQLGCAWVDLSQIKISPETLALLPLDVEKRLEVVPVEKRGEDLLIIAASQPKDPELLKELTRLTPWKLELVVAYDGYIVSLIQKIISN
ncbi:MAG: hypothetical protein MUQ00_09310 [Candidatus Aminicenantes bacterium]|nr:hypothetical protein [Candidatus Aminicenantes bacterium]